MKDMKGTPELQWYVHLLFKANSVGEGRGFDTAKRELGLAGPNSSQHTFSIAGGIISL